MYSLTITRYGRYLKFDSIEDLTEELKQYFSPSEIRSGIVDRLTAFRKPTPTDRGKGFVKNALRDFTVRYYFD